MKKAIFIAALFLSSFAHAVDWQTIAVGPFGGLNDRDNAFAIPANNASEILNVAVTAGGKSIKKRPGSSTTFSLSPATSPVHGLYLFYDASGNDVMLAFNERRINASIAGGSMSVIYSTATNASVYDCADYLGYAYCANSARDAVFKTSGSVVATLTGFTSTGTMVAALPTRLAQAGFSGSAASRIDFSGETDFTSWGTGSLGTSPVQITINAPGSRITHIVYAFGRLMWFKESSFGYIITGIQPAQTDWVIKTVSNNIGTLDNTSTMDPDGNLYFRGQDKRVYRYDGNSAVEFSSDILGTVQTTTTTASEQSYSTYFDNKLWVSVSTNGVTNTKVLIYDFLSQGWTIYTVKANGFAIRNNQLYYGSSIGGKVNKFGTEFTYSDPDGGYSTIWKSKYFFLDSPFKSFNVANISARFSVISSTTQISYFCDGGSSSLSTFDMDMEAKGGGNLNTDYWNKNMSLGVSSCGSLALRVFDIGSGSTSTFEIFAMQAGVRPNDWRPRQ